MSPLTGVSVSPLYDTPVISVDMCESLLGGGGGDDSVAVVVVWVSLRLISRAV